VSVARTHAPDADSALNVVRGQLGSLVEVANRVRVRVGPLTAEVTAASATRLELAEGGVAYATFKATGTRLVPL
jgi:molybdopterin-binding protein